MVNYQQQTAPGVGITSAPPLKSQFFSLFEVMLQGEPQLFPPGSDLARSGGSVPSDGCPGSRGDTFPPVSQPAFASRCGFPGGGRRSDARSPPSSRVRQGRGSPARRPQPAEPGSAAPRGLASRQQQQQTPQLLGGHRHLTNAEEPACGTAASQRVTSALSQIRVES